MAVGMRVAGVIPLAGATIAAMALAGAAVFTVSQAGCAEPSRYVNTGGQLELVGSCLRPEDLPPAPAERKDSHEPAEPVANQFGQPNRLDQVNP